MPFNEVIRSRRLLVSNSDVYNDITKSVQLLLSGAPLLLLSKTPEGYVNPLMAKTFAKPAINILALDEQNGKYFVVDGTLYDLILGKGKSSSQIERDRQILAHITTGETCPSMDSRLREKVAELRTEYLSRIDELKEEMRQ